MVKGKGLTIWLLMILLYVAVQDDANAQVIFPKPLSNRIANYQISVKLDPEEKALSGHEILTWRNDSSDQITELHFHLYMNAFKNTETTFMREGRSRRKRKQEEWGYIEVHSIRIVDGPDLTPTMEFIAPDDGNEHDQTVMRVKLPRPLRPHRTIKLAIDFYTKLPRVISRTGYHKNFFMVGQWFPKIGVFINGSWNCHQFHRHSEFFADFGTYDVRITVPPEFIVGATGSLQEEIKTDTTTTLVYRAEDVHDFAWTAYPYYKVAKDTFRHVQITLLYQPCRRNLVGRYLSAAKNAIKYYGEWYGEYPYPNLTIVDPAPGATRAGGMEYPTLITTLGHWLIPKGFHIPEVVTIHEFGHNYWYGMVASNEFEEAWLDEGINTYSEMKVMAKCYGERSSGLHICRLKMSDVEFQWEQYIYAPDLDPIYRPAWEFYSGASYGINSYSKPGLMLLTLENYLGQETMGKIMQTYFQRWKFKHPTTRDFINVVNEVSGQNLNWFFDQVLFGTGVVDYAVSFASSKKMREPKGIGFEKGAEEDTTSVDTLKEQEGNKAVFKTVVKIRRKGEVKLPVEVLMKFENGEEISEQWDGEERWVKYEYIKPTRLAYAQVDPEHKILLDVNPVNNSLTVKSRSKAVNRLSAKWLFWMQNLLQVFSFFS